MARNPSGWALMLVSTAAFGSAGAFAKPLIEAGWSPATVVTVRLGLATLALAAPAVWAMRGRWAGFARHLPHLLAYGLFAGMVAQVSFFNAAARMPVGVAILFEYLGVVWVVAWNWLFRGRRPGLTAIVGMALALLGLAVVVNPATTGGLDPIGVLWGLGASLGLAVYYVVSADTEGLPSVTFVAAGLGLGALGLGVLQAVGLQPVAAVLVPVTLGGASVPWWLPLAELALVAAALAYLTGFLGARRLGSTLASFVGLTEVLFAMFWAWLLLGEGITAWQALGGAVLLGGVALVQRATVATLTEEPSGDPRVNEHDPVR